ncbi:unnamed protein product [Brugia timori]|uniref:MFS transporter n=1 Tax=Brugia timori TaxID=42155 RepID=A0A0R3QXU8_9BILA|nr:unnamed protein product [Brugia timori]
MNNTNSFPLWSLQSVRLRIIIILAIALCIEGLMRTNMNMAMICMVNLTAVMQFKQSFNGDLLWTGQEQAWVFAAFYVGSLLVVFPGSKY